MILAEHHEQKVKQVGDELKKLLAGEHPMMVSAVTSRETRKLQRQLLKDHVELIRRFIPANVAYMIEHHGELPVTFMGDE